MKIAIVNGTRYRTRDVRRAVKAALAQTRWPKDKPIYVSAWHSTRGERYALIELGVAVWVPPNADLWVLAEIARFAIRRHLGATGKEAGGWPVTSPAWCAVAGLAPEGHPAYYARARPPAAGRVARARAKIKPASREVRAALERREAKRQGRRAVAELGSMLDDLAAVGTEES